MAHHVEVDLAAEAAFAARLAQHAGRQLVDLRRTSGLAGRALGDAADRSANELLLGALADLRPADPVLSEEAPDDPVRLGAERVWIVDPLDGTREYGEPGRHDWAVHVALWSGGDLTAAATVASSTPGPEPSRPVTSRPSGGRRRGRAPGGSPGSARCG